MTENPLWHEEI